MCRLPAQPRPVGRARVRAPRASATVALYRFLKWLPRPVAIQLRLDEDQGAARTRNPSGSTADP